MKKVVLFMIIVLICSITSAAQHYRGFVDVNFSMGTDNKVGSYTFEDPGVAMGLTTSHGLQINKVFVGAGVGIIFPFYTDSSFPMPIFAHGRYDFFGVRRINFFVDCRLGSVINRHAILYLKRPGKYTYTYYDSELTWGGFYLNPSVGLRIRLSNLCGINIALGYLPISMEISDPQSAQSRHIMGKYTDNRINISLGIDF